MVTERLASAAAGWLARRTSRRSFLQQVALVGSAVTVGGWDFVLRPGTAYASICGSGASCDSGWTAMCCTVNDGVNTCPPGTFAGGWWKADGSSLCGGDARYYIDCQAECTHCGCASGGHFCDERCWDCEPHCASGTCDKRRVCTNVFRYGQCNQDVACTGPVMCRAVSCTPPWTFENCSTSSATDNRTLTHSSDCLPSSWTHLQSRYHAMGSQGSPLGASWGPEHAMAGGTTERFQHGRMYWSQATGVHWLPATRLLGRYLVLNEAAGPLGFPVSDRMAVAGAEGWVGRFEHGSCWENHTSAHALWGDVATAYDAAGGPSSDLGWPTSDAAVEDDGSGMHAAFDNAVLEVLPGGDVVVLRGVVGAHYAELGWASGPLGYPVSEVGPVDATHVGATFEYGAIYAASAQASEAFAVWGPIYDAWEADGGPASSHGYPTSDVSLDGQRMECSFEHDYAVYDTATGSVTFRTERWQFPTERTHVAHHPPRPWPGG